MRLYVSTEVKNRRYGLELLPIRLIMVELGVLRCYLLWMSRERIKQFIEAKVSTDGVFETGVKGVQLFRVSHSMRCAPAVYEPTVIAIVNGAKEAILDGRHFVYDDSQYMCCAVSLPVEAGTPNASPDKPLLGVSVSLETRVMTELTVEMEGASRATRKPKAEELPPGFVLADWDEEFSDALWRLVQLGDSPMDTAVLGESRLRELYYAVLKGGAGGSAKRAFGLGNEIARAIQYVASRLDQPITIEEIADQVGMSRAVFHRKFKRATTLSPIQYVKSMRLNSAAMKIAVGMSVNEAALEVGYTSSTQFNREFKRMYGDSPRRWSLSNQHAAGHS